jgi:hypothetical protein
VATEQVAEQVAEGLEEAATFTRQMDLGRVGFFAGGLSAGFIVGFFMGYRWNRKKIRAEEIMRADMEIEEIRAFLQREKVVAALEETQTKPELEEIIEDRGYSKKVTDEEIHEREMSTTESPRLLPAPVPVREPRPIQFPQRRDDAGQVVIDSIAWIQNEESTGMRNPEHPYVIHQREFNHESDHVQVTWTFYAGDGVLVDEHDNKVEDPEATVGRASLHRFGEGADDPNVVFVRNDRLEMEFEICRLPTRYEVEVLGMTPDEPQAS